MSTVLRESPIQNRIVSDQRTFAPCLKQVSAMKSERSCSLPRRPRYAAGLGALGGLICLPIAAEAHVKWFAPYIVGAPPQPFGATLASPWFWIGIALAFVFFLATRAVETSKTGEAVLAGLDRLTDPLYGRLDDFIRVVIAAFFVAIFAVGGVYLTPDLKTPAEWVSWTQLLIAGLIFSRRTQPLAAAGIIGLWLLALRDYDISICWTILRSALPSPAIWCWKHRQSPNGARIASRCCAGALPLL